MPEQLSFTALFEQAVFEERTRHLPTTMDEGTVAYRRLFERYHPVVQACDWKAAKVLIREAKDLAVALNGGDTAILAGPKSSARLLERATRAVDREIPLWGQTGSFILDISKRLKLRVEMDGMFGLCGGPHPSFVVHAVEPQAPFISETGYRSFLGVSPLAEAGMSTADYAEATIRDYVRRVRKGKLCSIEEEYRERVAQPYDSPAPG